MRAHSRLVTASLAASLLGAACGGGSTIDGGPGTDAGPTDAPAVDMHMAVDLGTDAGPPSPCVAPVIPTLHTADLAAGHSFNQPVYLTQAPGDDDAFYVVEQRGRIQVYLASTGAVTTFLDVSSVIGALGALGDERGLLGLAFHPDYATNGRFFIGYRPTGTGANRVAEYHRSAGDPYMADPTEGARLVDQADTESNHNGGWVGFGPDGFLYVAMGDGGGGCDAHGGNGNGQRMTTLLGKMLRLDVDATATGYAAAGNPFSGASGLPQIWAFGLRNAWRNSFDRATGDFYMGDVGQDAWEEVDFQPASSTGGENYGWRAYEGTHLASGPMGSGCGAVTPLPTGVVMPITEYPHLMDTTTPLSGGSAITGGYVYRGATITALAGVYLYADSGSGKVAGLRYCEGALHGPVAIPSLSGIDNIASFGEDHQGELYLVGLGGSVLKIIP